VPLNTLTDKENGVLFSHKEEQSYTVCRKMNRTGNHHAKQNKPGSGRRISQVFSHMWNLHLCVCVYVYVCVCVCVCVCV
jgi:hypothetical protein